MVYPRRDISLTPWLQPGVKRRLGDGNPESFRGFGLRLHSVRATALWNPFLFRQPLGPLTSFITNTANGAVAPPTPFMRNSSPMDAEPPAGSLGCAGRALPLTRIICDSWGPAPGPELRRYAVGSNPARGGLFIAAAPPTPASFFLFFSGAADGQFNRRSSPAPLKNKKKEVWSRGSSIDRPPLRGLLALGAENPCKEQGRARRPCDSGFRPPGRPGNVSRCPSQIRPLPSFPSALGVAPSQADQT